MTTKITFEGTCHRVILQDRSTDDPHIMVQVETEDDGSWFPQMHFSSSWLDELISNLTAARALCRAQVPHVVDLGEGTGIENLRQFGWRFRTTP